LLAARIPVDGEWQIHAFRRPLENDLDPVQSLAAAKAWLSRAGRNHSKLLNNKRLPSSSDPRQRNDQRSSLLWLTFVWLWRQSRQRSGGKSRGAKSCGWDFPVDL